MGEEKKGHAATQPRQYGTAPLQIVVATDDCQAAGREAKLAEQYERDLLTIRARNAVDRTADGYRRRPVA